MVPPKDLRIVVIVRPERPASHLRRGGGRASGRGGSCREGGRRRRGRDLDR